MDAPTPPPPGGPAAERPPSRSQAILLAPFSLVSKLVASKLPWPVKFLLLIPLSALLGLVLFPFAVLAVALIAVLGVVGTVKDASEAGSGALREGGWAAVVAGLVGAVLFYPRGCDVLVSLQTFEKKVFGCRTAFFPLPDDLPFGKVEWTLLGFFLFAGPVMFVVGLARKRRVGAATPGSP